MAKFYVGQRIKKVRGKGSIGATAVFIDHAPGAVGELFGYDASAKVECGGVGEFTGKRIKAGAVVSIRCSDWEPMVPLHEPCTAQFKVELEALLGSQALPA